MKIQSVSISGFRNIRAASVELSNLNVLIGTNGSGKSNFLDAINLTGQHTRDGHPRQFCASDNLHPEATALEIAVTFEEPHSSPAAGRFKPQKSGFLEAADLKQAGAGAEDCIGSWTKYDLTLLGSLEFTQHGNHSQLRPDGLNLPYHIEHLKAQRHREFQFVKSTAATYAGVDSNLDKADFWKLSPGTLRLIALADILHNTAPPPALLMIENPEASLNPQALRLVAEWIRSYAAEQQIIITTSSPTLVDHMSPEDLLVCEPRRGNYRDATYHRIEGKELEHINNTWLKDYSLGELWEKNFLGGRT